MSWATSGRLPSPSSSGSPGRAAFAVILLLASSTGAAAQGFDVTFFVGKAFPTYDERLTLRPSTPSVPGARGGHRRRIAAHRSERRAGLRRRARLRVGHSRCRGTARRNRSQPRPHWCPVQSARYPAAFEGLAARVTISDGTFDADRIGLLSANVRVQTPGPVALIASGGLSYLPDINVTGSLPLRVEVSGVPTPPDVNQRLTLRAAPGQSEDRWGVNGGVGLRLGGRVALIGEVRVFYFQDYELRFTAENGSEILNELLAGLAPVRFDPVFVNAQAGVTFRF